MFICEIWLFDLVFFSIQHIWYVEVRISRSVSEGPFDFEITRVDCIDIWEQIFSFHSLSLSRKEAKTIK